MERALAPFIQADLARKNAGGLSNAFDFGRR